MGDTRPYRRLSDLFLRGRHFYGDTLFVQSCGRTDMYSSDFMDMVDSLTRLRSIKTNYHMYPGHEQDGMLFDQYAWIDSLVARVRAAYGR